MPQLICLWSGPRNVSTALMYSFRERSDTKVVDEPLYGHYLRVSGAPHPGRDAVLAAMNTDGDAVMRELLAATAAARRHRFAKHMAHHLLDLDTGFLGETRNVLLIRDPLEMLPSLTVQLPQARLADTGLARQCALLDTLTARGETPAVLDARQLLLNPRRVLMQLCALLDLDFEPGMLAWDPGPRPEDGVWAPHWYHAVHASRGFAAYRPKTGFPDRLRPLLEECRPYYDTLFRHALRAD